VIGDAARDSYDVSGVTADIDLVARVRRGEREHREELRASGGRVSVRGIP